MNGPDGLRNYDILQGNFSQNFDSRVFLGGGSKISRCPPWTPLTRELGGTSPPTPPHQVMGSKGG
jgi:hypothetical protein